jgi:hypothetical protein
VLEKIGANNYKLELPFIVRMNNVFHVNSLRPCPIAMFRLFVFVTTLEDDDDEYDPDRILVVKIDTVLRRRGKYLLFYTHLKDELIPHIWHRLNEVQRTIVLRYFLDSLDWLNFASRQEYMDFMRTTHSTRLPHSY